jgi:dihydroorotase
MARYDLLLKGGTVMLPGGELAGADIGVREGRIAAIGALDPAHAGHVVNCTGLHVLPGFIDTQVHFREPGAEHKEDLRTGSMAAVLGGITAVFEMPNTNPPTTTAEAVADKLGRARGRMFCDHAFYVGATAENAEELGRLERLPGVCGVKVFMGSSTGSLLVGDDETLARVLANIRRRAAFHSEDEERLQARSGLRRTADPSSHPEWRDVETAVRSTRRLLRLAREAGRRIHVLHVTTAEEMELLREARDLASVEVTPQHLTLAAPECYERLGSHAQMNPPIREARHREALWRALRQGLVDVIGSDHAPHTQEEKAAAYPRSPSGMPGVQTLVPLMLHHVTAGRLSLARLVDLMCEGPHRLFQIAGKGRIALGYDADFTIVDLAARRTIRHDWIASRCGWTPFDGMQVTGWPRMTIIRGRIVMFEDEIIGPPAGAPVRFMETLDSREDIA